MRQKNNETCEAIQLKKMYQRKMRPVEDTLIYWSVKTEKGRREEESLLSLPVWMMRGPLYQGPKYLNP